MSFFTTYSHQFLAIYIYTGPVSQHIWSSSLTSVIHLDQQSLDQQICFNPSRNDPWSAGLGGRPRSIPKKVSWFSKQFLIINLHACVASGQISNCEPWELVNKNSWSIGFSSYAAVGLYLTLSLTVTLSNSLLIKMATSFYRKKCHVHNLKHDIIHAIPLYSAAHDFYVCFGYLVNEKH